MVGKVVMGKVDDWRKKPINMRNRIMSCQHYFKKLDNFSVCALKANKGVIEVEPDSESCAIYQYVFNGSAKVQDHLSQNFEVKTGDFFNERLSISTKNVKH